MKGVIGALNDVKKNVKIDVKAVKGDGEALIIDEGTSKGANSN